MTNEQEPGTNPENEQPTNQNIETQGLSANDTEKAKTKGGFFGDPIFIVE